MKNAIVLMCFLLCASSAKSQVLDNVMMTSTALIAQNYMQACHIADSTAMSLRLKISDTSVTVATVKSIKDTAAVIRSLIPANTIVYLGNVTISETAVIAILAGIRKVTITGVTGVVAGDRVILTPTAATPANYAIADVVATATGTIQVSITVPAIALGGSYSITCKTSVLR